MRISSLDAGDEKGMNSSDGQILKSGKQYRKNMLQLMVKTEEMKTAKQ